MTSPVWAAGADPAALAGVLDVLVGADAERRSEHRGFDERTLAGLVAVLESEQCREGRVHAGDGIAGAVGHLRRFVGESGEPGQARDLFGCLRVPG